MQLKTLYFLLLLAGAFYKCPQGRRVWFSSTLSSPIPCLLLWSIAERGILRSVTFIVDLPIYPCSSISFASCILKLCLGACISIVIFSWRIYPKISVKKKITLFVSACLNGYREVLTLIDQYCFLRLGRKVRGPMGRAWRRKMLTILKTFQTAGHGRPHGLNPTHRSPLPFTATHRAMHSKGRDGCGAWRF